MNQTRTCSACPQTINLDTESIVDMRSYGLQFHARCFTGLSAPAMVRLMGEDSTCVRKPDGSVLRVRDTRNITETGDVRGQLEPVTWTIR